MTEGSSSRKVILLVDDDETHLVVTKSMLKDEYDVITVNSGEEAIKLLNNHVVPELILLDVLMPTMDGWEVFDKINDIAALEFTPIMFYTSLNEESAREKAYELGAFDFITKPCKKSVLISKIEETLKKGELKKQQFGV